MVQSLVRVGALVEVNDEGGLARSLVEWVCYNGSESQEGISALVVNGAVCLKDGRTRRGQSWINPRLRP